MGSEYPKVQDRRQTAGHLRIFPGLSKTQSRKSLSSASAGLTVSSNKIPKTALTPISRLKKFKKLRDKNLRKQVLHRNNIRKQLTMLETIEADPPSGESLASHAKLSPLKDITPFENGTKENGQNGTENGEENGLNGIEEEHEEVKQNGENGLEENEEVRKSPRRSRAKVEVEQNGDKVEEQVNISPVRRRTRTPEVKNLEVDVKVVESPASSPKRRSTPRRATPDISSTLRDRPASTPNLDASWKSGDTVRITGRRPLRDFTPPLKRKSDEFEEPSSKRMAFTPSVPSPGWRFMSPFSLFKRTPRAINRPVDDSLFVNVSTDSEIAVDLDSTSTSEPQSEENHDLSSDNIQDRPTAESPSKSTSWLCSIM